jgi:dipeptidyl aminopeptidase/acylaminoacyl peptidase
MSATRSTKTVRWLAAAAFALLLGAGALVVRTAHKARLGLLPARGAVSQAERAEAQRLLGALEDVSFRTSDGLTLRGWFVPGKQRAAVAFVHGGGGNRLALTPEAALLVKRGIGVLLYDSRAHGESDGAVCTWGDQEQRDLTAAIDWLSARPDVDPARLGLVGFSIGGSTVALVAAKDRRARAVLLHATWTTLEEELHSKFGKWGPLSFRTARWVFERAGVDLANVRPIDRIAAIAPRPLLIIAGTEDTDTPVAVTERLFAAAREPKRLWEEEHTGHGNYLDAAPAEFEARMTAFFEEGLLR